MGSISRDEQLEMSWLLDLGGQEVNLCLCELMMNRLPSDYFNSGRETPLLIAYVFVLLWNRVPDYVVTRLLAGFQIPPVN
jgi:hypothetical protein